MVLALTILSLWCPVGFASEPPADAQTQAIVSLHAGDLPAEARIRLEGQLHLRVLGVEDSGNEQQLMTAQQVSADQLASLQVWGGRDATPLAEATLALPVDSEALTQSNSFHLGFLRLVGTWYLETSSGEEGVWEIRSEQTLDYEVPVLKSQLTHPTICVTIVTVDDGARALVTASCEAEPTTQPLD